MLGFLVVDKPRGTTSHQVVERVRKLLPKGQKVGHSGTLDPLATGVLILALGKATRLNEYLLKQDKCYLVKGELGLESDTYDADGKVRRVECKEVGEGELLKVLEEFKGEVEQVPPPFSAIRVKGKRAYQLAREGKKVELPPRKVVIHSIDLLDFSYPAFTLEVCCSSGTYIRSLIHDIGQKLGCSAIVIELRRTKVGKVSEKEAVPLERLEEEGVEKFIIPPQELLPFPQLKLKGDEVERFKRGAPLLKELPPGRYSILSEGGKFLGVGRVEKGRLKPEKVLA